MFMRPTHPPQAQVCLFACLFVCLRLCVSSRIAEVWRTIRNGAAFLPCSIALILLILIPAFLQASPKAVLCLFLLTPTLFSQEDPVLQLSLSHSSNIIEQ